MKHLLFFTTLLFSAFCGITQEITIPELKQHVCFLAADSLLGRKAGTQENFLAATYIRDQFSSFGLHLQGEDGFQYFEIVTDAEMGPDNSFGFGKFKGIPGVDFIPFSFSSNGKLHAMVTFTGYGFNISSDTLTWNDYKGLDVTNRWVMILQGDPEMADPASIFAAHGHNWRKVLEARDHGAGGVLIVTPVGMDKSDVLSGLTLEKSTARAGIPVIHITRQVANRILLGYDKTIEELEAKLNSERKSFSFEIPLEVNADVDVVFQTARTQNVVALLPGADPALTNEYVIIGAHYDHLGMGGPGSNSRALDTIAVHNGADDNASGVAGLLELAEALAMNRERVKRSILFIAFDAEEIGLLGSKHFVEQSKELIERTDAMINFDMIGRFDPEEKPLLIGGIGTSVESEAILDELAASLDFKLTYSPEGFGASDHSSFYTKDIPVFFISSGAHDDYHMPQDDVHLLDYESMARIVGFTYDLILEIANREDALTFQEAGPREAPRSGRGYKVVLGIMPDFTSSDNNGLRVDAVRKEGPADRSGMLKGDVIVGLNGKTVTNIYDYMARLNELETGQTTAVEVVRDGVRLILLVQL